MTQSSYKKMLKQLEGKPGKLKKFMKHNAPKERTCGKANKKCKFSGQTRGVIHKYGLDMSRQLFRECAEEIGFNQYS